MPSMYKIPCWHGAAAVTGNGFDGNMLQVPTMAEHVPVGS